MQYHVGYGSVDTAPVESGTSSSAGRKLIRQEALSPDSSDHSGLAPQMLRLHNQNIELNNVFVYNAAD